MTDLKEQARRLIELDGERTQGKWRLCPDAMKIFTAIEGRYKQDIDVHVADIRGWGSFTGQGHGALGLSDEECLARMRKNGEYIIDTANHAPAIAQAYLDQCEENERMREALAFQSRCREWAVKCFGEVIADDREERCDRFVEEALELVQSVGWSKDRALALVDYVFDREPGDPPQEVGGVMVTLACLCAAHGLDMQANGWAEYGRINAPEIVEKIRRKQAAKPTGSALPVARKALGEQDV